MFVSLRHHQEGLHRSFKYLAYSDSRLLKYKMAIRGSARPAARRRTARVVRPARVSHTCTNGRHN